MSDVTVETKDTNKFDPEAFAMNIAKAMENSGRALAAYLKPLEKGEVQDKPPNELTEVIKTLTAVGEYWLSDNEQKWQKDPLYLLEQEQEKSLRQLQALGLPLDIPGTS